MPSTPIALRIPPEAWEPADGDSSRLRCVISINGTLMHLEALRVRYVGTARVQQAANPKHARDFDFLCRYGSEGHFQTITINRRRYVLIASPFGS